MIIGNICELVQCDALTEAVYYFELIFICAIYAKKLIVHVCLCALGDEHLHMNTYTNPRTHADTHTHTHTHVVIHTDSRKAGYSGLCMSQKHANARA